MEVNMKIKYRFALLLMAIFLTSCGGEGIIGKLTDGETGKSISDASVELDCIDCDSQFTVKTDVDGNFSFPDANAGNYTLTIVWSDPPSCPGIEPHETMDVVSGDFIIGYFGYGGIGGYGPKRIVATVKIELQEGRSERFNLTIECP